MGNMGRCTRQLHLPPAPGSANTHLELGVAVKQQRGVVARGQALGVDGGHKGLAGV